MPLQIKYHETKNNMFLVTTGLKLPIARFNESNIGHRCLCINILFLYDTKPNILHSWMQLNEYKLHINTTMRPLWKPQPCAYKKNCKYYYCLMLWLWTAFQWWLILINMCRSKLRHICTYITTHPSNVVKSTLVAAVKSVQNKIPKFHLKIITLTNSIRGSHCFSEQKTPSVQNFMYDFMQGNMVYTSPLFSLQISSLD